MGDSKIQWTQQTWNCVTGCTKVSAGCDHCYAQTLHNQRHKANVKAALAHADFAPDFFGAIARPPRRPTLPEQARERRMALPLPPTYDTPFALVRCHEDRLTIPLRRRKPTVWFVDSMSDLFHEQVPDAFLDRVFAVMALSPQHTFQVLTKRPERMRDYLSEDVWTRWVDAYMDIITSGLISTPALNRAAAHRERDGTFVPFPLPNVWLGVSAEDQARADERIPVLLETPAAVRFVSAEPLLGPIELPAASSQQPAALDWVIVGGESGKGARACDLAWLRSIRDQCQSAGVPVFVKQLGARIHGPDAPPFVRSWILEDGVSEWVPGIRGTRPLNAIGFRLHDRHGGNPEEWPEDLRVREMPA